MKNFRLLLAISFAFLALSACKEGKKNPVFEDPVIDPGVSPHLIVADFYFQGVVNGDTITFQDTLDTTGFYTNPNILALLADTLVFPLNVAREACNCIELDSFGVEVGVHYTPTSAMMPWAAIANPIPATRKNIGGIAFNRTFSDTIVDVVDYIDITKTGVIAWGRQPMDSLLQLGADGVRVFYIDEKGEEWASDFGFTAQPFGLFTAEQYVPNDDDPHSYRIIQAQFSARLYNGKGSYKDLIAGKFRGRIAAFDFLRDQN